LNHHRATGNRPPTSSVTIRDTRDGVELDVRVTPRAKKTDIAGYREDTLLVRVTAPPAEGAANEALVELLASWLGLPRRAVQIVSGERSRRKRLLVRGTTAAAVRTRIEKS
jgi:uncharacterized protein (TIGR00251 family)